MTKGEIKTLEAITPSLADLDNFLPYIESTFDKSSRTGIALLRPPAGAGKMDVRADVMAWSKDDLQKSGASWKQSVAWNERKGCGVIGRVDTESSLNLLAYYRKQRTISQGNDYPRPAECKSMKQLVDACHQDTLWPKGTWKAEAVGKEENLLWSSMNDPKVKREYEQERDLKFNAHSQGVSPDFDNMGDVLSALHHDKEIPDFPGINTPYAFFGGRHTLFGVHREDFDFLSVSRLLFGAPKIWYAIPSHQADLFETILKDLYPDEFAKCPLWYRQKLAMIDPATLVDRGITVTRVVQYPGDIVVTYPLGWHFGFNVGFNCAEAVNLVVDSWIPYGKRARVCRCSSTFKGWNLMSRAFAEKAEIHLTAHIIAAMGNP